MCVAESWRARDYERLQIKVLMLYFVRLGLPRVADRLLVAQIKSRGAMYCGLHKPLLNLICHQGSPAYFAATPENIHAAVGPGHEPSVTSWCNMPIRRI